MTDKGRLNLSCTMEDYETFSYMIESFYFDEFRPSLYADLLPYRDLEVESRPCKDNPLGSPDVEMLGAACQPNDLKVVEHEVLSHGVYLEFCSEKFSELNSDMEYYLLQRGVDLNNTLYQFHMLRVMGFIAGVYSSYFIDDELPVRSERQEYKIKNIHTYKIHMPGKTLNGAAVENAVKKAKALRKVLDPRLLMADSRSIYKLESLLDSLINLNSRVIDSGDKLEHYLFRGNTNQRDCR